MKYLGDEYQENYKRSIHQPESFWREVGERLQWIKKFTEVKDCSFTSPVRIRWYADGVLNASVNCIDRHLPQSAKQTAIVWEGDDPNTASRQISYQDLHDNVCRTANALKSLGVRKGDRVMIYLPMIPEAVFAMLACARLGAIHSVIFAGFSAEAIADRILDCEAEFVITADGGVRGGKKIPLKENMDLALQKCPKVRKVLVYAHIHPDQKNLKSGRDVDWRELVSKQAKECVPEPVGSLDPLFILYTSGSTSKPKGVLHGTGGYLAFASFTFEQIFNYKKNEVFWCTADVGWVTGHSYLVYGPLSNAATVLMFEGVPTYPDVSRFWRVIDKYHVNIFYTAPTAIRALMREGDAPFSGTSLASLRLLGSVGEPINPEAWNWYHKMVGKEKIPIVDTWWQTETGGILMSPLPTEHFQKPGSAGLPFYGIKFALLDEKGTTLPGAGQGLLCIQDSWPGQMLSVYNDHARFESTYFSHFAGYYFTGDGAKLDPDKHWWITGRVDDVLNVSGHRLGTAEIESALVSHHSVAEAAVVGFPHDIKGQGVYAFVTLKAGFDGSTSLRNELIAQVRQEISAIATPDRIQWAPGLPKTRSGKIMRRILRKIAENDVENLGDISTLADPQVVAELIRNRMP